MLRYKELFGKQRLFLKQNIEVHENELNLSECQ